MPSGCWLPDHVALRKESVDRNRAMTPTKKKSPPVALRKESVDRNRTCASSVENRAEVALRKESVDRNVSPDVSSKIWYWSLSARRAWIEMQGADFEHKMISVALRKESVDRNTNPVLNA